ncbi:REPEAT-CONTAINING PROTEIN putative-RELATED [Salix viminalis]|uniref:REPEAT-CONTAINING PROTEIN putative-RELATED n=1 Tax=Salix viminalis TaxID=40686 RepID=A0A9Q0TAP7_SALVM|nr:REPEAT-CONTAINING PROTEIN putative-RELATED [Salix viminalis]
MDSLVKTHPASVLGEAMIDSCRGKSLKSGALSFVLECYSHKGLFMESLEIFLKMRGNGFIASGTACNAILDILCKDGNFERIVKFLDMGIYNSVLYNGVIDRCSKRGDFEAAFERLNQMCERKLDPGFSTYSAILDGACKHGNEEVIERVMDIMAEKGLLPKCPLSQCDLVIQKFSDLCRMNVATMFFKRACDEKIGLQDATYGYQYEQGYKILGDMMRRGFRPGTTGLSKFISLLSRKRRWREVEDLLDVVLEKGLLPDSSCCCSLVEHYCSRRQIDKAVALHNKMEKVQASLDVATYNILLNGLAKNSRIEEVVRVFDYMEGLKLVNSESFTITIRGLCHAKEMRKAMKLHDKMLDMGLKPDKAAYKRLILEFNH